MSLRWEDVFDFENGRVRSSLVIVEKKTMKPKSIPLNKSIIHALILYATEAANIREYLIANPKTGLPISRIQAYRLIRAAGEGSGISERVSCHSLRKTFGYHAWKKGTSLAILQMIYNHSSFGLTLVYLGIAQDDIDFVYLGMNLTG